jgi:AcrR family transcriptional regulator
MCSMKINPEKQNSRKIQAEERRLQILDTALKIFAARGFKGTSIKDIAEAANISQGLMYHYFASKEGLLEATVEHHSFLPQLRQILNEANSRSMSEVFNNLATGFLGMLDDKDQLLKIFMQEIGTNPEVRKAWSKLVHEGVSRLQQYLDARVAGGELRPHKTEVTARGILGIIFMYHLTQDVFSTSHVTKEEFVKEALDNLMIGIKAK